MMQKLAALLVCLLAPSGAAGPCFVTYEIHGRVVVQDGTGWQLSGGQSLKGYAPAFCPVRDQIAYLYRGNVYLYARSQRVTELLTHDSAVPPEEQMHLLLPLRVAWDPSGRWIAYTRALPFRYDPQQNRLRQDNQVSLAEATRVTTGHANARYLLTIWIADTKTYRSRQLVGPTGDIKRLWSTYQMDGASVYEPLFSPDGKSLWFLNAGWLYESRVDLSRLRTKTQPRLVARLGEGLDFCSPGASKWGTGARMLAWDKRCRKLICWIGRFWGSGESEYSYMLWSNGRLGAPVACRPDVPPAAIGTDAPTFCAVDCEGYLWVKGGRHLNPQHEDQWVRQDLALSLPIGADRPSFRAGGVTRVRGSVCPSELDVGSAAKNRKKGTGP